MNTDSSERITQTLLVLALSITLLVQSESLSATPSTPLWQDVTLHNRQAAAAAAENATLSPVPIRTLLLDEDQLQQLIQAAATSEPGEMQHALSLKVPLPDGDNADITLQPVTVLSPELQQRYPTLKTWRVSSSHPRIMSGRAEFTTRGFQFMLRSADGDQWLIEPLQQQVFGNTQARSNIDQQISQQRHYQSYSKRQAHQQPHTFSCGVDSHAGRFQKWQISDQNSGHTQQKNSSPLLQRTGKNKLRYDLAIAATGEYTQKFSGSKATAYSAIVTTVNRINEIYEQELGITLQLVSGIETVFSNPMTDPFDNASPLLAAIKNQEVLDTLVGSNRYDIGHVLGAADGGDGIAYVASVCNNSRKAQGFTASSSPLNDSFIVDYVAHEIGHQLGATHTFNSTRSICGGGGRIARTAFEPGSGSTIMSYAGLCTQDNTQQFVDPQFHSGSVSQIHDVLFNGNANFCADNIALSNNPPQAQAGADVTIPARTPFILSGSATDSDGDKLLYGWDQVDTGDPSQLGIDTANNALIKSNRLSSTGTRYIPALSNLLNAAQSATNGESLPRSNRKLNFSLNVRDGKGARGSDDVSLSVHDTGSGFHILSPTSSLPSGSHTIRWQVASTDQPPINCAQVDIAYTNNQGTTFTDIKLQTPNDGDEAIQLTQRAEHIRVKCSDNIFFALSGTAPHIAAYKNDTAQPTLPNGATAPLTNTDGNTNAMTGNGGGGSISLGLLLLHMILAILSIMRLRPHFYQHTLTALKSRLYSHCGLSKHIN